MSSITTNTEETYKVESLQGSANYRTWKFSMRMVLQARDLWEVVSGEEVKPEEAKAAQVWEKKARKALATIALTLSAAEKEHIIECTAPKAAWDILEKLYEGKGRNRKIMLLQELFRMSMDGEKMDSYLRAVREKMSELSTTVSQVGGRHQAGHHSQWFAGTVSISCCQSGEAGEDRFRRTRGETVGRGKEGGSRSKSWRDGAVVKDPEG